MIQNCQKTIINNNGSPDIYWFPETKIRIKVQIVYNETGNFKFYDFDSKILRHRNGLILY